MAFIETIEPENATGELQDIYTDLLSSRGQIAEVLKIHSLNPKSLTNHMDLYMTIMFGKSPIKRKIREMMAVVVSTANNCLYCQTHHGEALMNFWKDEDRLKALKEDFRNADLDSKALVLAEHAWNLTKDPSYTTEAVIQRIRDQCWNDRAILDANMVVCYFNFVNRMVMGLGANLEENAGKGYKYD